MKNSVDGQVANTRMDSFRDAAYTTAAVHAISFESFY